MIYFVYKSDSFLVKAPIYIKEVINKSPLFIGTKDECEIFIKAFYEAQCP